MDEREPAAQSVIENVALLLRTGKFSDLTLVCQEHKFLVHKAIVCARSPVLAAATEGAFTEATAKVIKVEIVDAPTLQRALAYLYTNVYDDEKLPWMDYVALEGNDIQPNPNSKLSSIDAKQSTESAGPSQDHEIEIEEAEDFVSSETQFTQTETRTLSQDEQRSAADGTPGGSCHDCCCLGKDNPEPACKNNKLEANTLVYIFADYYQIAELKHLAVKRFAAAIDKVCHRGISDVCHLVYKSAPPTALDLRSCLSSAIVSHGLQLLEDESFMDTLLLLPELLRDAFTDIVRQHQSTSVERDLALAASLKAEDDAEQANTGRQEEKQQLIAKVNDARRCRHCGLESNVFFEHETSYLGTHHYSLRCKCRTRY